MEDTIFDLVRKSEKDYTSGNLKQSKYVDFDLGETVARVDAYANSKHISGNVDALGREKPFFNVVNAAINIWYKATDIDRKDIRFKATKSSNYLKSFIATIMLRKWMNDVNLGMFLNQWGRSLAKYGSSVVKMVEKDGKLIPTVIAWDRLICDPLEFEGNPVIEKLYYTPAQLRKMDYDEDVIKEVIENAKATRTDLNSQIKDNRADYICVYEIHGEMPLSWLTDKEKDEDEYRQQMQVIVLNTTNQSDSVLYRGKEKKNPYMLTHLISEDGRVLGKGAVEYLFEAQWMINHSAKQIKDQLDLASKMINQTADENFFGKNVLANIETGDILIHEIGKPLTQVNNQSHDIPAITAYLNQWQALSREQSGTPEAIAGQTLPSGTSYSLGAYLGGQAQSLFDLMIENKGLYLEQMLREYVIPFFKKSLNNADEVALVLDGEELSQFDQYALPAKLEQEIKNKVLGGEEVNLDEIMGGIEKQNEQFGTTRFLTTDKTWNQYFKDLEDDIEVITTGENSDKRASLETLNTVFQTLASNPMVLQDPNARAVFSKILEESGSTFSPVQLRKTEQQPPMPPSVEGSSMGQPQIPQQTQ